MLARKSGRLIELGGSQTHNAQADSHSGSPNMRYLKLLKNKYRERLGNPGNITYPFRAYLSTKVEVHDDTMSTCVD